MTTSKKCPENTTASHCSPWAHRSLRATQEWLQHRLWLTDYHQKFPEQLWALHCCKRHLQLVEWSQTPRCQECPWQCSTRWVEWDSRELLGVGYRFYRVNAVLVLASMPGPRPFHKNSLRTLKPSTAHFRPTGPESCPIQASAQVVPHCPPPRSSPDCRGLFATVKGFCSL